ncbi:MAG: hypothetical protein FWG64_14930 [Firmicutes bacterium]|nr:hypothetical protein [Bacillota bacterium]
MISMFNCEFNYYYMGEKTAHVKIVNGHATTEQFSKEWYRLPFGMVPDHNVRRETIRIFFEEHCIPKHRKDLQKFLDYYGLEKWDAFKICRITNGEHAHKYGFIEWLDKQQN